ncbi:MAG: UDP-N-acetylmuramoyl-tripeptide--D-alanyl-D-alanine ligase [Syntrophomonadaceae bacterium]|nr:UDP-N-acetylmuramoyl-tripeptide--D-alanyl-D-alanine ligase [Syntrophomonadaceae bacterium]
MFSISLDKLASQINGQILIRNGVHKIPLDVSMASYGPFSSILFLDYPIRNVTAFRNQLKRSNVRCLVIKTSTLLNIDRWKATGLAIIQVDKVQRAFRILSKLYRAQFHIPFIQVIGSSGKTTTTGMIHAILSEKYSTLSTLENTNSPTGVAFNLFRLNKTHRAAVLEAGMKAPDIMRITSALIKPDIVVVTSIHRAHLLRLGSIEKIIAAKAEVLQALAPQGTLIINWSDPNCRKFPSHRHKGPILRYGFSDECDLWASDIQRHGMHTQFTVHIGDLHFPCSINIIGNYNVGNALAAIAVGLAMRMNPAQILTGLQNFEPIEGRLKVYPQSNGSIIIDDNFNANPDSTRMLIDELIAMAQEYPVVLVIGDMERPSRDIQKYARRVHFNIGRQLARGNFEHVLAIGIWAGEYVKGAIASGFPAERISYYPNVTAAQSKFNELLAPGSIIVLKASPYTLVNSLRLNSPVVDNR